MLAAIFAGLLVSIDALFIGVSFGTNKKCKFWHVLIINAALFGLCILGYFLGILIGERIELELDLLIGILFITLGAWVIVSYFIFEHRKRKKAKEKENLLAEENSLPQEQEIAKEGSLKSIWLTGIFMSVEAMFITIGLTLTLDLTTILIPITVAVAHFVYSTVTFFGAKYLRRFPTMAGSIISGSALIIYGIMAIVI